MITMDKTEFIAKLQLCYVGDRNAFDEMVGEYDRLNKIIDTILDFSLFGEECPLSLGFNDKLEEEAQDTFYDDNYCEINCTNEKDRFKKCWLKYFNQLQELKENNK